MISWKTLCILEEIDGYIDCFCLNNLPYRYLVRWKNWDERGSDLVRSIIVDKSEVREKIFTLVIIT